MHQMPDETQVMQGSKPSEYTISLVVNRQKKDELLLAFQAQQTVNILGDEYKIERLDFNPLYSEFYQFRVYLELSKLEKRITYITPHSWMV